MNKKLGRGIVAIIGVALLMIVGIGMAVYFNIAIGVSIIAICITIIAIGIAHSSEKKMKALTALNFDEKMAMMSDYKTSIDNWKERGDANAIKNNKRQERKDIEGIVDRCKYDLSAISHLIPWAEDKDKEKLINNYVIKIIESNIENYQEKYKDPDREEYLKNICDMINIAFKIDSNNMGLRTKIKKFEEEECSHSNRMR